MCNNAWNDRRYIRTIVFYRLFVSTIASTLYMSYSRHIGLEIPMSFLFPFEKIIAVLEFFQALGIRRCDKYLVYS